MNLPSLEEKGWGGVGVLATSTPDHCVSCNYHTDCYNNAEGNNASNYVLLSLLPSV